MFLWNSFIYKCVFWARQGIKQTSRLVTGSSITRGEQQWVMQALADRAINGNSQALTKLNDISGTLPKMASTGNGKGTCIACCGSCSTYHQWRH